MTSTATSTVTELVYCSGALLSGCFGVKMGPRIRGAWPFTVIVWKLTRLVSDVPGSPLNGQLRFERGPALRKL